ncbi:hypothetical protein LEN26_018880 [Aphanomyces euteiches]|nr:hypothetical protein LEN26_018880 [Aphanomyces euteiches]
MIQAMIACMARRIVVVGNAGIGKSYLELVILLWWARRELRPDCNLDDFFDDINTIARLERGLRTDLFFKRDQLHYQIENEHLPPLSSLDSKSALFLYEPCESENEIHECGITDGRVWATASPMPTRYKEFSKTDCAVKYMECATDDELVFMAAVQEQGPDVNSPLKGLYKPASVRERIQTLGPFQRVVLPTSTSALDVEKQNKNAALAIMTSEKLLKAWNISEESSNDRLSISRHLVRMSPNMDNIFESYTLKPASNEVKEKLGDMLLKTDVMAMRAQLARYNDNPGSDTLSPATKGSIPTVLETFFVKHAIGTNELRWMDWRVAKSKFSSTPEELESGWTPNWAPFSLKVTHIDRSKTPTYAQIVRSPNAIFYMNDPAYPFVDFYWYDTATNTVNASQASKSFTGHPKYAKTFNAMKEKLQLPVDGKLVINIIPLPIQADSYANGSRGKFVADVKKDAQKFSQIQKNVEVHVIKMVLS